MQLQRSAKNRPTFGKVMNVGLFLTHTVHDIYSDLYLRGVELWNRLCLGWDVPPNEDDNILWYILSALHLKTQNK